MRPDATLPECLSPSHGTSSVGHARHNAKRAALLRPFVSLPRQEDSWLGADLPAQSLESDDGTT